MSKSMILDNGYPAIETVCTDTEPSENSVSPFEYAFYLLGPVRGKTVVEIGCGDGFSQSILPQLGARLTSGNIANQTVVFPVRDGTADHVLCGPILRRVDPVVTGRQLRRVLKPGGTVVFNERIDNPAIVRIISLMRSEFEPLPVESVLTRKTIQSVSRAVGVPGRQREFWVTTPILARMEFGELSTAGRIFQRVDAALLRRWRFMRRFAFRLVWEARKEC